ncbi:MAG: hypothetical protein HXY43_19415 [Fischerella sp.]|jgi:hypothetical protein|nr:hypothetical protein [Fischerella sp.]NWF61354.1 hypothetical protein [Fischerella sp.]
MLNKLYALVYSYCINCLLLFLEEGRWCIARIAIAFGAAMHHDLDGVYI